MSQIKILHVIAGAERGGAETFCLDAILALDEAGIKQHVIGRPHPHFIEALNRRGIPFTGLSFGPVERLWRAPSVIRKTVAEFQPGLVHAWMGRAASFIPQLPDVPVLGWFGGYYDLKRYATCDFYMGVTKDIVRHIAEKSGKPHRTFLVHTFGTLDDAPAVDRALLGTPVDAPAVLLLSRMHEKKGVDVLLRAAALMPGVYFWLAGEGPRRKEYEQLARSLKVEDRVRFLGWRTDRAALLKAADVCVLPSRYEPFGTVMAEAWFARTPLVAANADGPRHYVRHGETGLLCAIDDVEDLAAQLRRAIGDESLRQSMIESGFMEYDHLFSKKVVVQSLIYAYCAILRAGKEGADDMSEYAQVGA
jgi:glycosyltransferase involved in cell wall biosynthesis